MSNQVVKQQDWWEEVTLIKQMYGRNLTNSEFSLFVKFARSMGANPLLGEAYTIKRPGSDKPAEYGLSRDFFNKKAEAHPRYDGHVVEAVYSNDQFEVVNGLPKMHKYSNADRGKLLGAYIIVYRKGVKVPLYMYLPLSEYFVAKSNSWRFKPETMMKAAASRQGFKAAFPSNFEGVSIKDTEYYKDDTTLTEDIEEAENWGEDEQESLDTETSEEEIFSKMDMPEQLQYLCDMIRKTPSADDPKKAILSIYSKYNDVFGKEEEFIRALKETKAVIWPPKQKEEAQYANA